MHIGILLTGHAPEGLLPEHGDYDLIFPRLLADQGLTFSAYPVVDMEFPESAQAADGWLITGSRFGAYENHPWIAPLEALIHDAHATQVPMVGICFGHQIIAQALGGKVEKFAGGWAVGRQSYDFDGLGKVTMNAWHQDQVTELPAGATPIAANGFCENAALVYDDWAYTVQAHPEFTNGFTEGLIRTRGRGLVPDALLDAALQDIEKPIDAQIMADQIAAFFKQPRTTDV